MLSVHPLQVKGAGNPPRQSAVTSASPAEVAAIAAAMPERVRAAVYVMAFCGLRFSELRGLRRGDVDIEAGVLHVRQQIQEVRGKGKVTREGKSTASMNTAPLPASVATILTGHMETYTGQRRDALGTAARIGDSGLRRRVRPEWSWWLRTR